MMDSLAEVSTGRPAQSLKSFLGMRTSQPRGWILESPCGSAPVKEDKRKIAFEAAIDKKLHQISNDTAVDFGQPFLAALVQVAQRILIET